MFVENEPVTYKGIPGIVTFVGSDYIIIELPAAEKRSSPKLLVYNQEYKNVTSEKHSQK